MLQKSDWRKISWRNEEADSAMCHDDPCVCTPTNSGDK